MLSRYFIYITQVLKELLRVFGYLCFLYVHNCQEAGAIFRMLWEIKRNIKDIIVLGKELLSRLWSRGVLNRSIDSSLYLNLKCSLVFYDYKSTTKRFLGDYEGEGQIKF